MKLKRTQVIQKRLVKSILWLVLTPFLLLGLTIALIHLPPIQNFLSTKITNYLTEGTGYRTEIDYVNIRWFNSITADGAVIYDNNNIRMIGIDELVLTFDLKALLGEKDFHTKEAWIYRADVNLRTEEVGGLNIDDWARKITSLTASDDTTNRQPPAFILDEAELIDSQFSISDSRRDSIKEGFNYNHFQLININAELLNLRAVSDSFQVDIKYLTTEDKASGLKVDEMKSYFRYSNKGMHFIETDLQMGDSRIRDDISFLYKRPSQMAYFVDSIQINATLNETIIHSDDLSYFAPEVKELNSAVTISGDFDGLVKDFIASDFILKVGDSTHFKGNLDIQGLPDIQNTFFDVALSNSTLKADDIAKVLDEPNYEILSRFGLISFNSRFDGFINNFVADGYFETALGAITSNVQITPNDDLTAYEGGLELDNFDLGSLTSNSLYQFIDLSGNINGVGLKLDDAQFNLIADIDRFGINGYEINNIETDGAIAESFFSGQVSINDPNLILFANGSVDLRDRRRIFNLSGNLESAHLDSLNITKDKVVIGTEFNLDLEGIKLDSLIGDAELLGTYVTYNNQYLDFDTLKVSSQQTDSKRSLTFESNHIDIDLDGSYSYSAVFKDLNNKLKQLKTLFRGKLNEAKGLSEQGVQEEFNINYNARLKNIDPIIHLFDSTLSVSDNSLLQGSYQNDTQKTFELKMTSDEILFFGTSFIQNEIVLSGKNLNDLNKINTVGYIFSEMQDYGDNIYTEDLTVESVWDGTHIDFRQSINQESSGNYAEIGADLDFYDGRLELNFEDSNIIALEEFWRISDNNKVVITTERIDIDQLNISNKDQSLSFNGALAIEKDSSQNLNIDFKNVEIRNINSITQERYEGLLNGELVAQNLFFEPTFLGSISMADVTINDFPVGDVVGAIEWNDSDSKFEVDFDVKRDDLRTIALTGDIFPLRKEQLDLYLKLNGANLQIAEPYIAEYFTEIGGIIDGEFIIGGRISEPLLRGNGNLTGGQIKINYLNTLYSFDGKIEMKPDSIFLENMDFRDAFNHQAKFAGVITHDNYSDVRLDLNGDLVEFQVLNLPTDLQADFYGEAYATGTVSLIGEAADLTIEANARTEPNTKIFIPITKSSDEDEVADYIEFIDRTDTTSAQVKLNEAAVEQIQIDGLTLDLDIEITPDAYAEIIIDARSGDIIRGRGNGQLRLVIDPQGDFQMTGDVEIEEGAYNFSLYSIINKEFQIEQPSNITWYGDPYSGIMSIKAAYLENTPITPILKQSGFGNIDESTSNNSGRRVPVKVLLDLQGPLLSPEITFDIDFGDIQAQDYETVTSINAFKNKIQTDEQELNRQVLSLILLGKFSDEGNVNIVGGTTSQSVSQLLSNQLSQLVAQLDENLEIDFDLRDLSDEAFNTMRLRLSYTFLEGRLRVTREGGLSNIQDVNSAVGDWTAEYLLTPDGRYKVKIYYRNNYDYTAGAISQTGTFTTTGASVTQTSSFNSFGELFRKVEKSREENNSEKDSEKSGGVSN